MHDLYHLIVLFLHTLAATTFLIFFWLVLKPFLVNNIIFLDFIIGQARVSTGFILKTYSTLFILHIFISVLPYRLLYIFIYDLRRIINIDRIFSIQHEFVFINLLSFVLVYAHWIIILLFLIFLIFNIPILIIHTWSCHIFVIKL